MPRFSRRWLLIELKSHRLVSGFVLRDFCTFGKFSIDVLTIAGKSLNVLWEEVWLHLAGGFSLVEVLLCIQPIQDIPCL